MSTLPAAPRGRPAPWLYLFGVIAWTWTFVGAAAFSGRSWLEFPAVILSLVGLAGPIVVPLLLIAAGRWDGRLDASPLAFLGRSLDPRTLPGRWYLWIIGLVLILALAPLAPDPSALQSRGLIEAGPAAFLVVGLLGALEEPGWRGYAQEGLQRRLPVVVAGLVIGVFWALWHLPLFFIEGTYQQGLGVGTAAFWGFNLAIIAGSPLYAWLYNASGRVVFAAALYHGLGNIARELVPDASWVAEVGVEAAMALVVTVAAWRWMRARRPAAGRPSL